MGEGFVQSATITRYGFRIRTRSGLIVDNLLIHGRDEADAERKLLQMYQHCKILERSVHKPLARHADKPQMRRTELAAAK
jgi:alpha-D-ribose 1-methylphosphonate 5-triphosphate synthase subunit PhnG